MNQSLRRVYLLIEKIKHIKVKLQKLDSEDFKTKELKFLKKVIQRTMSKTQLESLMIFYYQKFTPTP